MKLNLALRCLPAVLVAVMPVVVVGGPLFGARTDYVVGSSPTQVAVGDLNGDGIPDVVTANQVVSSVSVLLGVGDGTLGAKTDFATQGPTAGVAIGDLNGDGIPDLATTNHTAGTVSILLGVGDGTFGAWTTSGAGAWPVMVAIGDLNQDGKPDLAVANANAHNVSVLLGNGNGTFGSKTDFSTGALPVCVVIGDLNADGKPDLVTANQYGSSLSVLLGNGDGTFGPRTDYETSPRASSVAIGDLNGDGKPDLATANDDYYGGGGTASVLLGNGDGTFGAKTDFTPGLNPRWVAIGDLNMDGKLDLAVTNYGYATPGHTVSVLLGAGNGTFGSKTDFVTGTHPFGLAIGDLNLDGRPDLVIGNGTDNTVSVLLNQPIPLIVGVRDVVNDQGGRVKVLWNASRRDLAPYNDIESYWILRSVPSTAAMRAMGAGARVSRDPSDIVDPQVGAFQAIEAQGATYYWEYIATQPAFHTPNYSYVAATTSDSVASSNPNTAFMIMARTAGGAEWWFSDPDSGYSVDNLPPASPAPFAGQYAGGTSQLHWGPSSAMDFATFRLYRGTTPGFVPGPGNLVVAQADTTYTDHAGAPSYYRLSAVDIHGNESGYAFLLPSGTTDVPAGASLAFALSGARPNPARGERLNIAFALPTNDPARLEMLDVSGRRVAWRDVGSLGAGSHAVELTAGRLLAPGLYLVRLTQGVNTRTTRLAVVQ